MRSAASLPFRGVGCCQMRNRLHVYINEEMNFDMVGACWTNPLPVSWNLLLRDLLADECLVLATASVAFGRAQTAVVIAISLSFGSTLSNVAIPLAALMKLCLSHLFGTARKTHKRDLTSRSL